MIATDRPRRTVVLVDPPYYRLFKDTYALPRYPLSLGYLAAEAHKHTDWRVVVYNADFAPAAEPMQVRHLSGEGFAQYRRSLVEPDRPIWREIAEALAGYQPDVVGISCKSQTFASVKLVAHLAKRAHPDCLVLVGGPHAAMVGAEILDCPDVDVVAPGEGERTLVELLKAVESGRPLMDVAGLHLRKGGRALSTGPRPAMDDLDALCFPHEAAPEVLHDYELYGPEAFSHVFATRGCPYACSFCGSRNVWGQKVRFRSAENVVEEIGRLRGIGVESVHFDDDTFGVTGEHIGRLCERIAESWADLEWSCELHVNLVNDANLAVMARAGCRSIQLGIESGNNEVLRQIRKGFTIEKALAAAETIRRHGVAVQAFFMVGFPEETEATLADTAAAMRKIDGMLSYSIFTPYPGTEAFDYCLERGLVDEGFNTALHNHQSPENCFCLHIGHDRFRKLVSRIERMVDRHNWPGPIRRLLSGRALAAVGRRLGAAGRGGGGTRW